MLDLWAVNLKFYILVSSDIKLIISNNSKHNILINECFTHPDYNWDWICLTMWMLLMLWSAGTWFLSLSFSVSSFSVIVDSVGFLTFIWRKLIFLEGKSNWRSSALVGKFTSSRNNFCFLKCIDTLSFVYWFCRMLWKSCIK